MAKNYLGEVVVAPENSPFKNYTPTDWAMEFIAQYGQIDGSHHKQWVLDQVARILRGTPVIVRLASWGKDKDNIEQQEYRFDTGEPSEWYKRWVYEMKAGEDGAETYGYDEGIAP